MIGVKIRISTQMIVVLVLLLVLIVAGLVGWIIAYPATIGYVTYDTDLPVDFELSDAEQALVGQGYSVWANYTPDYYQNPYLEVTDAPRGDGVTIMRLSVDDQDGIVHVFAMRRIRIPPYGVFWDLTELGGEHQRFAEEDIREVLDVVGLPSSGTFTFRDDIDSLDYILPATVFYFLVFVHLPLVLILAAFSVVLHKEGQHTPREQTEPSPRIR